MKQDILDRVERIHSAGIGGSGMCPLVEIFHHEGLKLTGSDMNKPDMLDRIRSYGVPVSIGHKAEGIGDAQLLVYTAAIKHNNPELMAAKERGIPVVKRSVMLGIAARRYEDSVAVLGTRGKTTITTVIVRVCIDGGAGPSAAIDGKLPIIGGGGHIGKSQVIICEACEYVDTFLQLTPAISVTPNTDADHLDYFGTLENITKSFHQFSSRTSRLLVINDGDPNYHRAMEGIQNTRIITSGMNSDNNYAAGRISDPPRAYESFSVYRHGEKLSDVVLSAPGKHNIMSALAAATVSDYLGIDLKTTAESSGCFTDVYHHFGVLGKFDDIAVTDDFAHHPTELTAALTAASCMGFHVVWALFQPHTYSRTYPLFNDFAKALSISEHVVLSPILAIRETNAYHIYSKDLAEKVPGSVCLSSFGEMMDYAMSHAQPGDSILTLGGGDIYRYANLIVEKCQREDSLLKA